MSLRDLTSLSSSELKSFLDSFDNVLCDCDGVIYNGRTPIPGIKETISKLKECGKDVRFVSNNSSTGMENFRKKMQLFGLDVQEGDIVYPSLAIISYLKKISFDKEVFLLGSSMQRKEFIEAGFKVSNSGPDKVQETYEALAKMLQDDKAVGAVVVDFDVNLNYNKLLKAAVYLKRPDVIFITGATDKTVPVALNTSIIGPKGFQDILADLTGRASLGFGKPNLNLNKYIVEKFGIQDASRTLIVGDSLEQDMKFASKCGYQKLLTLTGLTSLERAKENTNVDAIPDFYIDSLGELHELIKNKLNI